MYSYRVTKYNPKYRNKNGIYMTNEWTSISDFNDKELNGEYMQYESAYIKAIYKFMELNGIEELYIDELEKDNCINKYSDINIDINNITNYNKLNKDEVKDIVKSILREIIYAKLKNDNKMEVHFGYDYYMYILSEEKINENILTFDEIMIYVEEFESPYIKF